MKNQNIEITEALNAFFETSPVSYKPFGNGHINNTFLVVSDRKYILQRMNSVAFSHPEKVMENIIGITDHISHKVQQAGGDITRATLIYLPTKEGDFLFRDSTGSAWRMCEFTENTVAYETVESAKDFYNCAKAFGIFQQQLSDYPVNKLHESLVNFHNTPWRYENLMKAVEKDCCGRLAEVTAEVAFARERKDFCKTLELAREAGTLPLRVTHNDTKLNNILFDATTGAPVCVVDLDTVMPGYSVNDFGDSIRFGANTAAEDETDLSKVALDLDLFEAYAQGFLKGCNGSLTETEIKLLPVGAMMMTLECGMRFLTDYLEGDVYFQTHRPGHNLDRARNQFALVADMEGKLEQMNEIVAALQ